MPRKPKQTYKIEVGPKDAAFIFRDDGAHEVLVPKNIQAESSAPTNLIRAAVLAWIVAKPEIINEMQARFEKDMLSDKDKDELH